LDDAQQDLSRHLRVCHSLPFPAGSLVPRFAADTPSPWLPELTPQHRARFAVKAMVEEDLAAERAAAGRAAAMVEEHLSAERGAARQVNKKEQAPRVRVAATRDYDLAAQEWAGRHPACMPPGKALVHLTRTLRQTFNSDGAEHNLGELLDKQELAVTSFRRNRPSVAEAATVQSQRSAMSELGKPTRNVLCYGAPSYRCTCMNDAPDAAFEELPNEAVVNFVQTVLLTKAHGHWTLLTLLFLKKLHTHLAIGPHDDMHPQAEQFLYRPVGKLLQLLAAGNGRRAAVAAGLRHILLRLHPYTVRRGDDGAIALHLDNFPACFDPRQPDHYGTSEVQAALTLKAASLGLEDAPSAAETEALTREVSALALELAAALTEPQISTVLPLTDQHARNWTNGWEELRKLALNRLREGKQASSFDDPVLLSRAYRLVQYAVWLRPRLPKTPPTRLNTTAHVTGRPA